MKPILRATAMLSSSSIVTIIVGLVSAKAFALLLGPSGLGFMGLLQSLVGLSGLVTGMGIGTGLVRMGAEAIAKGNTVRLAALRRAAWIIFWGMGSLAIVMLILLRVPVSRVMLGSSDHAEAVVLMGLALLFSLASGLQTSTLNAYHQVGTLAKIGIANSILGTAVAIVMVWALGEWGISAAVISMTAANWLVSRFFLVQKLPASRESVSWVDTLNAARELLRFGGPYTSSMLVGAGVQLFIPVLVLNTLGQESVGYFRAAVTVSVTYLGFLLTAMAQDYFPRVSAASGDKQQLIDLANQQHRLVMLLGVPLILGMLALATYLIPLVYSVEFQPAVAIVEWQLVGDILKFSSWTLSFVILVRSGSVIYFVTEIVGGASYLMASFLGMKWFGLAGLGMGHLLSYAIYFVVVYVVLRKQINFVWTTGNVRTLSLALAVALAVPILPLLGFEDMKLPVALAVAIVAGLLSLGTLWREVGGKPNVRTG